MRIAILGGSFNPPHIGHYLVAAQVRELFSLDKVWLLPNYIHPFDKKMAAPEHRLSMTRFLENEFINVSSFEIDEGKVSYTIDTLRKLHERYSEHEFYWISGSDQLEEIKLWKEWETLIVTYNFIIFPRQPITKVTETHITDAFGFKNLPKNFYIAHDKALLTTNISSTVIRNRVQSRKSIQYLVPKTVAEYIKEHKLYE